MSMISPRPAKREPLDADTVAHAIDDIERVLDEHGVSDRPARICIIRRALAFEIGELALTATKFTPAATADGIVGITVTSLNHEIRDVMARGTN